MEYNTIGYYEPQRHLNKSPSESYVTRTVPGSKEGLDEEEPKSKDGGLLITGDRCSPSEGVVSAEVSDEVQNNYASGDNPSHDEVSSMRSESSQKPSVHALTPNDSKFCRQLLESLKRHSCSWPFAAPVDPVAAQAPDYFDVIKHPMDLSTIESKFMSGEYKSPKDFLSEVRLMLNNCFTYNPPTNIVYQHGKSLEIHLNLQISKLFPSLIAGDDPDLSGDGSPDLNDPRRRSRRVVKPSRKTDPTGKRSQAQDTEGGASGLAGAKSIPKSAESADLPEELLDGSGRGGSTENAEEERHNEEEEYKREEGLEPLNDIDSAMDVSIYPGTFDRIEDDYSHRRRRRRHLQDNNRRKYQYDTYTEMDNHTIPKSDHSLYEKDQDNEFGEYGDESGASDWEYIRDIKSTLMSCLKTVNIHIALLAKRKRRKSSHKISQNFYPYKAQKYAKKIKRKGRKEYGGGSMDFKNCMSPDSINTYTRLNQDGSKKYCEYCGTSETPMWRRGPSGCGTLCNKCGVKWRSGKIMDSVLNSDFLRYKQNFENDFEDKESKQSNPPVNESADKESSDNEDNDQQSSKTNVAYSKGPLTENGAKESKEAPENQNSKNSEQRAITYEQKRELSVLIDQLPDEYMYQAADIIRSKLPHLKDIYEDIELDIDTVDETVLVALYDFVTSVTRKKNDNEKSSVVYDTADKNDKAAKGQDTAPNGVAVSDNMVVEKLRADDAIIQESAILSENKGQAESINPVIVGALE